MKPLTEPLLKKNALTIQVLGICSALAVTVKLEPAFIMGLSVTICSGVANLILASIRNYIPPSIRFIVQLMVVSLLVIIIDQVLKAYAYEVSKQLSVYVGLIICNCIIMGRMEAFAMANKPLPSFLDGIGNGAGYALVMILVAFIRELFGAGTMTLPIVGEFRLIPDVVYSFGYHNNNMMILPPMALIILGVIIWIHKAYTMEVKK